MLKSILWPLRNVCYIHFHSKQFTLVKSISFHIIELAGILTSRLGIICSTRGPNQTKINQNHTLRVKVLTMPCRSNVRMLIKIGGFFFQNFQLPRTYDLQNNKLYLGCIFQEDATKFRLRNVTMVKFIKGYVMRILMGLYSHDRIFQTSWGKTDHDRVWLGYVEITVREVMVAYARPIPPAYSLVYCRPLYGTVMQLMYH